MVGSFVSHDTELLASESPVRAMKFTLGTIVTPQKHEISTQNKNQFRRTGKTVLSRGKEVIPILG